MINNIPDSFSAIMTNINVISQEMSQYFVSNRNPTIDFTLYPNFKIPKSKIKELSEQDGRGGVHFTPEIKNKYGGSLAIYARSSLSSRPEYKKDDWLYIEFGFLFTIKKGSLEYKTELYTQVYGNLIEGENNSSKTLKKSIISNKKRCINHFRSLCIESIDSAIHNSDLGKDYKKSLQVVKKNLKM
jgi:hypothetical protein